MIINLNNDNNVENIEELQKEVMDSMKGYISNLISKLKEMENELLNDMQEDTWEYLRMMIDGFNWVLEAYNGTSSIINSDKTIDENLVQKHVENMGDAYMNKDPERTAETIKDGIVPFLEQVYERL